MINFKDLNSLILDSEVRSYLERIIKDYNELQQKFEYMQVDLLELRWKYAKLELKEK